MSSGKSSLVDRSMRSVLVGNIPNEAKEGNLRDLLSEFGPILNVRYFKDSTCQYALCEYGEQEMALRAIRNLTNYEMRDRSLKVDIAGSERSKDELARLQASLNEASETSDITTEKAPEEISKAVASLPAEQMFELMKQMKMCIENNPQEARNLLLQNPQLAYALLQAQVIMRIVDPEVALKILNRPIPTPTSTEQESKLNIDVQQTLPAVATSTAMDMGDQDLRQLPPVGQLPPVDRDLRFFTPSMGDKDMRSFPADSDLRTLNPAGGPMDKRPFDPRFRPADPRAQQMDPRPVDPRMTQGSDPRMTQGGDPRMAQGTDPRMAQGTDPRMTQGADPRMTQGADPRMAQGTDPRMAQGTDPRMAQGTDPRMAQGTDPRMAQGTDPRMAQGTDPRMAQGFDPRTMQGDLRLITGDTRVPDLKMMPSDPRMMTSIQGPDPRHMQGLDSRMMAGSDLRALAMTDPRADVAGRLHPGAAYVPRPATNIDPRVGSARVEDPRKLPNLAGGMPPRMPMNTQQPAAGIMPPNVMPVLRQPTPSPASSSMPEDEEKAALIMQVLQLSDEQIAVLPPEQRQSIMVLKEQIARSQLTL